MFFKPKFVSSVAFGLICASGNLLAKPTFDGLDAKRTKVDVELKVVGTGFDIPTDLQFVPGSKDLAVVLEKGGTLKWLNVKNGQSGVLAKIDVLTASEEGLLGLAFHPKFPSERKLYLNYVVGKDRKDFSRIAEFVWTDKNPLTNGAVTFKRTILEFLQPYPNHNAGQLAFGPDGYLYIGTGDGGSRDDPHNNAQDLTSLLGKMLRIDIDAAVGYVIPKDNPFIVQKNVRPEIWAYGIRNPWRYTFAKDGTLIVADVGQNTWEEVSIVTKGANLGWKIREGFSCFKNSKDCKNSAVKTIDPIYVYGRDEGISITGGYVYDGKDIQALAGKYIFSDYVSGRIWAIPVDASGKKVPHDQVLSLGKWDISPTSFGKDDQGDVYVVDVGKGEILKIQALVSK